MAEWLERLPCTSKVGGSNHVLRLLDPSVWGPRCTPAYLWMALAYATGLELFLGSVCFVLKFEFSPFSPLSCTVNPTSITMYY